ncbi:hypothetical protein B0H14DRAFT_2585375 [Mycena olivaceomarginata]|nr:hypothetical protein B0H14DRAFT_2585375 [Mycena olivaceomarginata]
MEHSSTYLVPTASCQFFSLEVRPGSARARDSTSTPDCRLTNGLLFSAQDDIGKGSGVRAILSVESDRFELEVKNPYTEFVGHRARCSPLQVLASKTRRADEPDSNFVGRLIPSSSRDIPERRERMQYCALVFNLQVTLVLGNADISIILVKTQKTTKTGLFAHRDSTVLRYRRNHPRSVWWLPMLFMTDGLASQICTRKGPLGPHELGQFKVFSIDGFNSRKARRQP